MDIYILRDGQEIGPLSEETTQTLLKQGSVLINDLAWRPGMEQWIPLAGVLYPATAATMHQRPAAPVAESAPELVPPAFEPAAAEPITAKQKAFLSFMGVPFSHELTRESAALLVNDAMENPADSVRLERWNDERLRLHPELFHAEIQARKENRSAHFLDVAEREGADVFDGVTKAHTQVLVGFLDVQYPNWDAHEHEATWNYLFPAMAEKFPQLVKKEWKGRLKYAEGPKVATELKRRSAPIAKPARTRSPVAAAIRGLAVGAGILIVLYAGNQYLQQTRSEPKASTAAVSGSGATKVAPSAAAPAVEPAKSPAPPEPLPPVAPPPASDPGVPAAPMAGDASAPTAPALDEMTTPFDPNAPAAIPSLPTTPVAAEPLVAAPRTSVLITKPIEVKIPFGSLKLLPGTAVRLVAAEGASLRVRYLKDVILIPAASTDFADAPALPSAAPAPAATTAAPPPAAPTPPPPTSLF